MKRIACAVIVFLAAGFLGGSPAERAAGSLIQVSGVCNDPTLPCWVQGRHWYEGISKTWGFGILPEWVIPTLAGFRFLNTGANIPHMVVAINTQGGRRLSDAAATVRTSTGRRTVGLRRLRVPGTMLAWDLGPVPDGSVVWFQVHVVRVARHPTQTWLGLYGELTPSGTVNWARPIHGESAELRP